jgi:molybdate transport system regulatory protein
VLYPHRYSKAKFACPAPPRRASHQGAPAGRDAIATLKLKLQLYCDDEIAMGPGKAAVLQAIGRTGSISAAGRELGMSYRRAWLLVDTMNRCFAKPLVEAQSGSGARVTEACEQALADYLALADRAELAAAGGAFARLEKAIRKHPG